MKTTPFSMTVNTQEEADFLISHLKPEHTVLEWGSGASTIEIAKHVKKICSIEHNEIWFNKVVAELPQNAHLCHVPYNTEEEPGDDGTYENYMHYVDKAIELSKLHGPFDIIFIDGRARVACAKICHLIGHKDTLVFIHDYDHPNEKYKRTEYFPAEEVLNKLGGEFTMWKFNIKAFDKQRAETLAATSPALSSNSTTVNDHSDQPIKKKVYSNGSSVNSGTGKKVVPKNKAEKNKISKSVPVKKASPKKKKK